MKASDFILQIRADLQEKSEFYKDKELFFKLQRCYSALQFDLPSFIHREMLNITDGKKEYYLNYVPLKNVSLVGGKSNYEFTKIDTFIQKNIRSTYTFEGNILLISSLPLASDTLAISYYYEKELATEQCNIEIPMTLRKALRYLVLSDIYEKPTLNSKQRDLSSYYISLYEREIVKQRQEQKTRVKNITSKFQRI